MQQPLSTAGAGRSILIVDDCEKSIRLLNDLLEGNGYRVWVTGLGEEAQRLALERRPNLILMDLKLPDMCGLDVTRGLKLDPRTRSIPIVAVTARAMAGDERKGLENGCDAYLTKPVRLLDLLRTIEKFLD